MNRNCDGSGPITIKKKKRNAFIKRKRYHPNYQIITNRFTITQDFVQMLKNSRKIDILESLLVKGILYNYDQLYLEMMNVASFHKEVWAVAERQSQTIQSYSANCLFRHDKHSEVSQQFDELARNYQEILSTRNDRDSRNILYSIFEATQYFTFRSTLFLRIQRYS